MRQVYYCYALVSNHSMLKTLEFIYRNSSILSMYFTIGRPLDYFKGTVKNMCENIYVSQGNQNLTDWSK